MLWLGWVSVGAGCEGSVAAGWWLGGKQRQEIPLVQNLGPSTRADVPGQTILLPGLYLCPWRQSPTLLCLSSYTGLNCASEEGGAPWGHVGGNACGCSDLLLAVGDTLAEGLGCLMSGAD